jgi:CRISPR-associated protein Cas5d
MMPERSSSLALRARGDVAIFTRPELKVERVSYPVMTPSAARGVLEAVLWKPAIRWHVEAIRVLKPIRFVSFRRNEVKNRAQAPSGAVVRDGGELRPYFADEDRAQRNTVALRDVDYIIDARLSLTSRAGPEETLAKFTEMFRRRVARGQHFHQPYLGCRECVADVLAPEGDEVPVSESRDLGLMLWDIEFGPEARRARYFQARLDRGVLRIPSAPDDGLTADGGAA